MPTDSLPFDDAAAPPAGPVEEAATAPSVLIVDDEEGIRNFLSRSLERRGWRVATAGSAEDGALHLERHCVDLIILDIALPGRSGLDWLRDLHAAGFGGDVILITAFADIDTAIEALRAGAADLILKPFRVEQIVNAIGRCMERTRLQRENFILRRQLAKPRGGTDEIIGRSAAIARLRALIERVAPSPSTVLIEGESGVGKELVARALHTRSHRADRPFVALNCAAVSADLVEAELFGHLRGAFTGAREARKGLFYYAHGGTLFLDEIGELPLALQSKLLRVLEERRIRPVGGEQELPVDVRVVAATNRDLKAEVAAGRFRSDLFYRLAVMTLRVPPLRERGDDVVELARRFMGVLSLRLGVPPLDITPPLEAALIAHPWPGNVRELRNLVERALLFGEFPQEDLGLPESGLPDVGLAMGHAPDGGDEGAGAASGQTLAEVEKRHILTVLADCGGNRARAAAVLGVSRKTLDRKWAEWGV